MPTADASETLTRARLRGKRAGLGIVIAAAVIFIADSAVQIIPAVFGAGIAPLPRGAPGSPERTCAVGLRDLAGALLGRGPGVPAERAAGVERACAAAPNGKDAWAALERLRFADAQLAGRDPAALEPLTRDLAEHLPADLR
jgi:hypothetical protein